MTATARPPATPRPPATAPSTDTALPGPAGDPLLGMALPLRRDLLGTLHAGFARYGDVVAYRVGPARGPHRLVVALHHPDDVRRFFADTEAFTRRTASYRAVRELFGRNIATAEGDDWRRQKRLLQPLLTRAAASRYAAVIEEEAHAAVERLGREPATTIDALRTTERYALRVLSRTLFGDDRGIDDDTVAALERLIPVVSRQMPARAKQTVRLPLAWPTPRNRRFAATRSALHATIERVLARAPEGDGPGLLSQLRAARDPAGGEPLSEREIRDQALMFLLAGYTTTSAALCSTLQLLGCHPEAQEQVAAGGEQWADAAVQEGLRLYPPSYVLGRRVGAGGAEVAGRTLPPGTGVLVSPWVTHRHPGFWRDPERFDPSRFADAHARDERPQHAWFPFGGGARACIGRHLSLAESRSFVRALLERCRIESLDADMPMDQLSTIRPSRPVRIRCRPR
ncbi:MAG: cytochrome P450 [Actinobacteria bacterium]|nr:cytochrome P450 [Actinomycetota bacterium]